MNRRYAIIFSSFVVVALLMGLVGWLAESMVMRWVAPAIGLALISIGLGVNSLVMAADTDRRMSEIQAKLARIVDLQVEIQEKQKEQASSGPPIVASLQAMSQYYMDYINKQKGEDNK